MMVQVGFGTGGGSGTPVPDMSIEVDDIDAALARFEEAKISIDYGPADAPVQPGEMQLKAYGGLFPVLRAHDPATAPGKRQHLGVDLSNIP